MSTALAGRGSRFKFVMWAAMAVVALAGLIAPARAQEKKAHAEIEPIDLPLPPGCRSVQRLLVLPAGIFGVAVGEGGLSYFRYDAAMGKVAAVAALPEPWIEPRELLGPESACTWDASGKVAYSLSPDGKLLRHTMEGGKRQTQELGQIAGIRPFEDKPEAKVVGYQISHAMFFDPQGNLYTAGKEGFLFRYTPATRKLEQLKARLPAVRGREPWASLDAAVQVVPGQAGVVYGGTFDGYLFTFDPKTMAVVNLGKPLRQQRIAGLVVRRGKVYGIGGEEAGFSRTFAYDPATHGFLLRATLLPAKSSAGALVIDKDGRMFFGTTGRLGNLYAWDPAW